MDTTTPTVPQHHVIADMPSTRFFVDDEAFGHVCAVEFSDKHLLFCIYVRDDHDVTMERLRRAGSFRIALHAGATCVVDETFRGFRFDRVNYRVNTGHFIAAAQPDDTRPRHGGLWVAELRFVAPLRDVGAPAASAPAPTVSPPSPPSPKESV